MITIDIKLHTAVSYTGGNFILTACQQTNRQLATALWRQVPLLYVFNLTNYWKTGAHQKGYVTTPISTGIDHGLRANETTRTSKPLSRPHDQLISQASQAVLMHDNDFVETGRCVGDITTTLAGMRQVLHTAWQIGKHDLMMGFCAYNPSLIQSRALFKVNLNSVHSALFQELHQI